MINELLKKRRLALKREAPKGEYTLESVASAIGCTRGFLSLVEKGTYSLNREQLEKIALLYNLDEERFLTMGGFLSERVANRILTSALYWDVVHGLAKASNADLKDIKDKYVHDDDLF